MCQKYSSRFHVCCLYKAFILPVAPSFLHKPFLLLNSKIEWDKVHVFCILFTQNSIARYLMSVFLSLESI